MAQLATRLDDDLLDEVDKLVAAKMADSRSDAVRIALRELIERRRRAEIGQAIVDEYTSRPQSASDVGWSDASPAGNR